MNSRKAERLRWISLGLPLRYALPGDKISQRAELVTSRSEQTGKFTSAIATSYLRSRDPKAIVDKDPVMQLLLFLLAQLHTRQFGDRFDGRTQVFL